MCGIIEVYIRKCVFLFPAVLFGASINGVLIYTPGDTLELQCSIEVGSDPQYSWTRDNDFGILPPGTVINTNTITVSNLTTDDTGNYTCTVSNDAGSSNYTVFVIVYGECVAM